MAALAPQPTIEVHPLTPRRRLFAAFAFDIVTLLGALLATFMLATVWLLTRTGAGRIDPTERDAVIAFALLAAALPTWTAWQWRALARYHTSAGMHRIAPGAASQQFTGRRRVMWFLLHPVTVPAWIWLALTALIPGLTTFAAFPVAIAILQTAVTLTSGIVVLIAPSVTPSHVRIARGRPRRRRA